MTTIKRIIFFATFFLVMSATMLAQAPFEGIITMSNNLEPDSDIKISIKNEHSLFEVTDKKGKETGIIANTETGDYFILDKENRIAVKYNTNGFIGTLMNKALEQKGDDLKEDFEVTVTSETATKQGYLCTKVLVNNKGEESIAWVTKEIQLNFSDLIPFMNQGGGNKSFNPLPDMEGFPIEIHTEHRTGKTQIVTNKVEEQKMSDATFDLPKGYEIEDLNMMNLLKNMMNGDKMKEMMKNLEKMQKE